MDNIIPCYHFLILILNYQLIIKSFSHFSRLLPPIICRDGRSYIRQYTVFYLSILFGRDIKQTERVQRVSRIRRTVLVQGMVGITVVGNDDYLVIVGFGSFHRIFHTFVDSFFFTAFSMAS